jgi:uncharacterized protein YjiS (DUF1127 family)
MKPLVDDAQLRHAAGLLLPRAVRRAVAGAAAGIAAWYRRRHQVKRSVAELSALSDHLLKDIGIHRSEILSIAHSGRDTAQDRM